MEKYNVVIGIEIHLELNTKTKMFSSAKNDFNSLPNTNVSLVDLAYPGTLPRVNKEAVKKAIQLAKALKMEIDNELHFDRKNYFYPDLPKGFQITQQFRPIGKNGKLDILNEKQEIKTIEIERIHLEEDTAKQLHTNEGTLLNYNRAGVPLIEIVTQPVISSAIEAANYIEMIRKIALFLNISDAKMEEGSLRADVNLSINLKTSEKFGTKVEIKNINSISNVKKAIELEIQTQIKKLENGEVIEQETKRFDDANQVNKVMRKKTGATDYRYYPEPNIPFTKLSQEFIDKIQIPLMPWELEKQYQEQNIPQNYIDQLLNDMVLINYFQKIQNSSKVNAAKILFSEIVPLIKEKTIENIQTQPNDLDEILSLLDQDKISSKQVKEIILIKERENLSIKEIISKYKIEQIQNNDLIIELINNLITNNKELLNDFDNRPERVLKFFLGQIMKETKGQANPKLANDLLIEQIKKHK